MKGLRGALSPEHKRAKSPPLEATAADGMEEGMVMLSLSPKGQAHAQSTSPASPKSPKSPKIHKSGSVKAFILRALSETGEDMGMVAAEEEIKSPPVKRMEMEESTIRGGAKIFLNSSVREDSTVSGGGASPRKPRAFPDRRPESQKQEGSGIVRSSSRNRLYTPGTRSSTQYKMDQSKVMHKAESLDDILDALQNNRFDEQRMAQINRALPASYMSAASFDDFRESFIARNGLQNLVRVLRLYSDNVAIQDPLLTSLVVLGGSDLEAQRQILKVGGVEVLLNILSTGENEMTVQDRSISALVNLLLLPDAAKEIHEARGLTSVVAVMNALSAIGSVQAEGCAFLSNYGVIFPEHRQNIVDEDGIHAILECMNVHSDSRFVLMRACLALRNLAYKCPSVQRAMYSNQAVATLLKALQTHCSDGELCLEALLALYNLVVGDHISRLDVEQTLGIKVLVTTMSEQARNSSVLLVACALVHVLVTNSKKSHAAFIDAQGIELLIRLLGKATGKPKLLKVISAILKHYVEKEESELAGIAKNDPSVYVILFRALGAPSQGAPAAQR
ncbi:Armadillo repeat-containing protein 6 [Porphyridium purpureum]|uniref:Armadillo repeat-containing protein 6 n=1 Tax=Porphyridium purpureum TaxID=35688 RepID=A0A5J4YJA4_PORPP|nr:Armadillo repeat-containing protein 6 [Porphyridium purpureum]|eukprot:POR9134..scf251_18